VLVGKEEAGRRLAAEQADRVAAARAKAAANAGPVVVGVAVPASLTIHSSASFVGSLLHQLGRPNAVEPRQNMTQFALDFEAFTTLNPSTLVFFTGADETPIVRTWSRSPLWASLPAAQRNRVYEFDRDLWTRSRGIMALKLMIEEAVESGLLADTPPPPKYAFRP
jgi:iron complex transport system substrate-binding protein